VWLIAGTESVLLIALVSLGRAVADKAVPARLDVEDDETRFVAQPAGGARRPDGIDW
jgi:hypothetical protein